MYYFFVTFPLPFCYLKCLQLSDQNIIIKGWEGGNALAKLTMVNSDQSANVIALLHNQKLPTIYRLDRPLTDTKLVSVNGMPYGSRTEKMLPNCYLIVTKLLPKNWQCNWFITSSI